MKYSFKISMVGIFILLLTAPLYACSCSSQPDYTDTSSLMQTSTPPTVTIDSFINNRMANIISDPCGDAVESAKSTKGSDLEMAYALMNADYLFAAMQLCDNFDTTLTRYYFVDLDMNGDQLPDYSIGVATYNTGGKEAGKAWILTYGGTNKSDWHVVNNSEAPEIITSYTIMSGLLKIAIPRLVYSIPGFVSITFRISDGTADLDSSVPFIVTSI